MGDTRKSIKLNFIFNAILTLSLAIFPLITFPYVSRVLLPEGVGKVNLAVSVIAYFNLFAQLGIPTYGVKACAKVRDDKEELSRTVHELFFISLILSALTYVALIIVIMTVPKLQSEKALYLIVSSSILLYSLGMEWMYQGLEEYSYITVRSLIFKAIALVAIFLLVKEEEDYILYAAISVFATSVPYILNLINSRKFIYFKWLGGYKPQRHFKVILIFFALACTTTIYTNLDNVMLGFMRSDAEVGLYSTAVKIKVLLVSLITSLGVVLLPRVSYYAEKGLSQYFKTVINKAIRFVIVVSIPVVVFFIIFAPESIAIIAGPAFEGSVTPMRIIMPTVLFIGLTNVLGMELLVPTGREKAVLWSTVIGAVVDLILNALLIPRYGASGAAIGTLSAELSVLIFQLIYLRAELKPYFENVEWLKIILAVAVAAIASIVCRLDLAAFKSFVISAGIFFVAYFVILMVCKEKFVEECIGLIRGWTFLSDAVLEKIFLIAYGVYVAFTITGSSTLVTGNPGILAVVTIIRFAAMILAIAIIFVRYIKGEYTKRDLIIFAGVTAVLLIAAFTSKVYDPIKYWIFIVAAFGIELRKIIKTSCIAHVIIMAIIVVLSLNETAGMVNVTFVQGDRIRQGLGFIYTTFGSNLWMYTTLMWLYWRQDKAHIWEHAFFAAVAIFFYIRTDTRSAFALTMLAVVISLILKIIPALRKCYRPYRIAALAISIAFPLGIIIYSFWGNPGSALFQTLNRLLNGRLELGQSAFETFGVTLFGQQIEWIGGTGLLEDGTYAYNYVDSSYVQMLLNFGIIFIVMVIAYFVFIMIRAGEKRDTYLLAAVSIVIIHATFDPQLVYVEYDAFAMALSYVLIKTAKTPIDKGKTETLIDKRKTEIIEQQAE